MIKKNVQINFSVGVEKPSFYAINNLRAARVLKLTPTIWCPSHFYEHFVSPRINIQFQVQ